ncbi:Aflatoxin B1 aldehyde reductase member 4-like [Oopsacas minuta]|uniref:Aflatoxin B1 aldehyde reductase member 4-like n=1 Tax=Oopsacas minuta TaxID=111878 RepID=A0AAV7K988_9METZ|nr:Aflatoxin B1 aldehyde reductase member 4-like [Oopsacas minuta]
MKLTPLTIRILAYGANHGVTLLEASLRWMLHHSLLAGEYGDGLILGASSLEQTKENVEACQKGPLDPLVVAAFQEAWCLIKGVCPDYFR